MQQVYEGGELDLFREARRWKSYWRRTLAPWIRGSVLEVGAGTGSNTELLRDLGTSWTCLEPNPAFCDRMRSMALRADIVCGSTGDLPLAPHDTILYLDALEHILDDREELERARARLGPGGHLVVLAPAHGWLYSPFDRQVGHHRRYDLRSLRAVAPPATREVWMGYLDAVGMSASAANRVLLSQSLPTARQLAWWDRYMVPLSERVDPWLRHRVGKSVVAVWGAR